MDSARCVFAALIWHDSTNLISDLIRAANCNKSQPEILACLSHLDNWEKAFEQSNESSSGMPPMAILQTLKRWQSLIETVIFLTDGVDEKYADKPSDDASLVIASSARQRMSNNAEEFCELCEMTYVQPITTHMRTQHPGCGGPSYSHGYVCAKVSCINFNLYSYNSGGNYTTGWTGVCGEGGQGNAVWYLLCPICRVNYLKKISQITSKKEKVCIYIYIFLDINSFIYFLRKQAILLFWTRIYRWKKS